MKIHGNVYLLISYWLVPKKGGNKFVFLSFSNLHCLHGDFYIWYGKHESGIFSDLRHPYQDMPSFIKKMLTFIIYCISKKFQIGYLFEIGSFWDFNCLQV